jgi:CelD/BcsL family acetyltransferase involved in cellulose biosynthesis
MAEVVSEVDQLASADDPARAFLRQAWFDAGELAAASEYVMARTGSGRPMIAFPLGAKRIGPFSVKQVAGAYWPLRGVPTDADCTAEELAEALADPAVAAGLGRVWRMGPVIDDDSQLKKLVAAAELAGWTVLSRPVGSIFALDLAALTASGSWPSNKGKQKDRWRVRQLEKTGPVRIEHFTGVDWSDSTRDAIAEIERNSWVGQLEHGGDTKFLNAHLREVWEGVSRDPAIAKMIRGSLLFVGDRPAAFTFGMDCGTTRYCIANNFDQQFHKFSPGRVLLYDDFTSAATRGITHLDWGLGDGGYKRQMGAEETSSVSDLLLVQSKWLGALLRPIWRG